MPVFKPTYTAPIPEGAKLTSRNGKRFARFKRRGKLVTVEVVGENGDKCRMETKSWHIRFKDSAGRWQREKAYTDYQASEQLLAKREREVARELRGETTVFDEHHIQPLQQHLADFRQVMEAKDITPGQVSTVVYRVKQVVEGCHFVRITDISASRVETFLADLRRDGASVATSNHYLRAVKQFTKWLVKDKRTGENRLAHLRKLNEQADRRYDRRALDESDFARLVEAAETGPPVERVSGPDRAMG